MLGILCEKPSAARNFAKALGGMSGTYDGTPYKIAASRGHLFEFAEPAKQVPAVLADKYGGGWSLDKLPWSEDDFSWKRVKKKGVEDTLKQIEATLKGCDEIAIATDVDPSGEGELLAWEILDELGLSPRVWSRFYFTDEAPASIQKAFKTRKQIPSMLQDGDYRKALYRSQWDFMSMQFTRIAATLTGSMLRQGRLKSAMVRIVGEGLAAVAAYKKVPYYQWRFKDENGNVFSSKNEPQVPDKTQLQNKYGPSPVVVDKTEEKQTVPPKLIDLAGLSSTLAGKGHKAKQVLDVYQKMYEDQVVSYPRTEDKVITPEQFNELLPFVDKIAGVVGVDVSLLTHRQPRPTHVRAGGAHGANRPGTNVPNSLADLSKYGSCAADIYTVLARSYLAMLCENYVYKHQEGHLEKYPDFTGSANQAVSAGYKAVYSDGDDDDQDGKLLGTQASPFAYEGFPPKPPVPTMKWLMKQLEKRDVGTGATRTSTYSEVSSDSDKNALLKDTRGKIALTDLGQMSYLILPGTNIGSLDLTEKVYADMRDIADGKADGMDRLKAVRHLVLEDISTMRANMSSVQAQFPDAGNRAPKEKISGIYTPTGQTVEFAKEFSGHEHTPQEIQALLAGQTISFDAVSKAGKNYTATGKLAEQTYKGKKFWGFALEERPADPDKVEGTYKPKKKKIRFKRTFGGHTFTDQEVADLLEGKEISFQAVSKAGKNYTATGKLKEQSYNGTKYWGFAFSN